MEGYPNCTGSHSGQQNPQIILRTQLDTLDSQDHVLHLEALELERKKRDLAALRRQLFEKANVSFPGSQGTLSAEEADPREQTHEVVSHTISSQAAWSGGRFIHCVFLCRRISNGRV